MRAILIGLGDMGMVWYRHLIKRKDFTLVAVVDKNSALRSSFEKNDDSLNCVFYADATKAVDEIKPDIIFNVTPPCVHNQINLIAFERNIPILCEKPIAENDDDVRETVINAGNTQKLMIAENYRYMAHIRYIKNLLIQEKIGEIIKIRIDFSRFHTMDNYHMKMEHPLLLDVSIHHLDALRYLTGDEVESIFADLFNLEPNHYAGFASANLLMKMKNGAKVIYSGSLDSHENNTGWYGDWILTGKKGVLRYINEQLFFIKNGQNTKIPLPDNDNGLNSMIDDFITYVRDNELPETHISDYIKTDNIVRAAIISHNSRKECRVK